MALLCTGKGIYKGQAFVAVKGTGSRRLQSLGTYYAARFRLAELRQFVSQLQGVRVSGCLRPPTRRIVTCGLNIVIVF